MFGFLGSFGSKSKDRAIWKSLGINPNIPTEMKKSAIKKLLKENHPDLGGDPNNFQRIVDAWHIVRQSLH